MKASLNCSIERTRNFVYSALAASDDFAAGDVIVIGTGDVMLGILAEQCAGATVRAASVAAGNVPKPDRGTFIFECEDVTIAKAVGALNKGDKVYWNNTNKNVQGTPDSVSYPCGTVLEDAASDATTVRIYFNGIDPVLNNLVKSAISAQGTIPIQLTSMTDEDGDPIVKQATTASGWKQMSNAELVYEAYHGTGTLGFSIPLPQDVDNSADVVLHVVASTAGTTDTNTIDAELYCVKPGDVGNADGCSTAVQNLTKNTVVEYTFTLAAASVLTAPAIVSGVLTFAAGGTTDSTYVYGVWLEYKKQLLAT